MILRHRSGHYHGTAALDVGGIVPGMDGRAQQSHVPRPARIGIAPGYLNPSASGHERQGAHPGAADAHEVDWTRICGVEKIHGWRANLRSCLEL